MQKEIEIPEGVKVELSPDGILTVSGPKGELKRQFSHPWVRLWIEDGKVIAKSENDRRKNKAVVGTWIAHVQNMFSGVLHGWEARLKIVYSHFPVKVAIEGQEAKIQNFMGERKPRIAKILPGVEVQVKGADIIVKGIDKEKVGQTTANFEIATKVKNRDRRIFSDGIWITQKPKVVE